MEIIGVKNVSPIQKENIFRLWNEEYPSTIAYTDIKQLDDYLDKLSNVLHHFLMDDGNIIGWAITFIRENETWFAIIIDQNFQCKGLGALLLNHLKKEEAELNGWVIEKADYVKNDGSLYNVPLTFYLKNGFNLIKDARLEIPQMKAMRIWWENDNLKINKYSIIRKIKPYCINAVLFFTMTIIYVYRIKAKSPFLMITVPSAHR